MRVLEGPTLPEQARGQVIPWGFGALDRVPAIPVKIGRQGTLAQPFTPVILSGFLAGGSLSVSPREVLEAIPSSGKLQLGSTRLNYTAVNPSSGRVTLAFQALPALDVQPAGTTVHFIEQYEWHLVCENPFGRFFTESVSLVYLGGTPAPSGVATVFLDHRGLVPGASVVAVRVDVFALTAPPNPFTTMFAAWLQKSGINWPLAGGRVDFGYVYQGLAAGSTLPLYGPPSAPSTSPPPPPPPPRSDTTRPSGTAAPVQVTQYPAPVSGQVSVQLNGLRDDEDGSITGTPFARLDRPHPVTKFLLLHHYREAEAGTPLRTAVWAEQAVKTDGIRWGLLWRGAAFQQFRETVGLQARSDFYLENGEWVYRYRDSRRPPVRTFTLDEILGPVGLRWTPSTDLSTRLPVSGFFQPGGTRVDPTTPVTVTLDAPAAQRRHGVHQARALTLDWIAEESVARTQGAYWLTQWSTPRLLLTVTVPWAYELELGDMVRLDIPLMVAFGKSQIAFEIRGITDEPGTGRRTLQLVEGDPQALTLKSGCVIGAVHSLTLPSGCEIGTPTETLGLGEDLGVSVAPGAMVEGVGLVESSKRVVLQHFAEALGLTEEVRLADQLLPEALALTEALLTFTSKGVAETVGLTEQLGVVAPGDDAELLLITRRRQ